MYYRAKHHKNRTKGMLEAMKTFEPWMKKNNIKVSSRLSKIKKKRLINCCKSSDKDKECLRSKDGKIFKLPRRFTKKTCKNKKVKGFSMRSSCSPYKYCK